LLWVFLLAGCEAETRWCDLLPREQYLGLERVAVADDWFEVYRVGDGVLALYEPSQFQEVISYLILGTEQALLFDTGMGISPISAVVRELTSLPVTVINSHTHYDHIGGNAEFERLLAVNTEFTRGHAAGVGHEVVQGEVSADAFCRPPPPGFDSAGYAIRPFAITDTVGDGSRIELGGRTIQVLRVPGHTPDALAVLDSAAGYLWTGDTFYEAPIWLWFPETDWPEYERSVERLAALAPGLRRVFGAHNTPIAEPAQLTRLRDAVADIKAGRARWEERPDGLVEYPFRGFSVLTRKSYFLAPEQAAPE
jgi:glyoxylase-like metal-dependent hydrolase (beta-lactamase superfamily II)